MKREDVPQDSGLLGPFHYLNYAVDPDGRYTTVPSSGWDPIMVANGQAWERIRGEVEAAAAAVRAGQASPLAWWMARNLMDPPLLGRYAGVPARRVRRHLTPKGFRGLDRAQLARYAEVFRVTPEELGSPPLSGRPEGGEGP